MSSGCRIFLIKNHSEHLLRCHSDRTDTPRCFRCYSVFENEDKLGRHQRALEPCEVWDEEPEDLINAQKQDELRSIQDQTDVTDIEKWRRVYRLLFNWGSRPPMRDSISKTSQHLFH